MVITLCVYRFIDLFNQVRPQQFTHDALIKLFEYYEELDTTIEFDPVAICCEWSEYPQGSEEHIDAEESGAYIIMLDNGNALVQEY